MFKKILMLAAAFFIFTGTYAGADNKKAVAIMYHDVTENPFLYSQYSVSRDSLEEDIKEFLKNGYTFLKASQMTESFIDGRAEDKFVALTFDDGYESFYTEIFPLLKKYNVPASFYILTSETDKYNHLSKSQLKALAESDLVELGAHSHYVHKLGRDGIMQLYSGEASKWDAYEDYKMSIELLEGIIGKKVTSIAYPNGIYTDDIDWILKHDLGMLVTISTDFGKITDFNKPLSRVNRDLNYTSEKFVELINSL